MSNFNKIIGSEIVIDTGIILEYYFYGEKGDRIEKMIFLNELIKTIYVTPLTLLETYYLIYRKKSKLAAQVFLAKLKKIIHCEPLESYLEITGEIKANNAISIGDCTSIALANHKGIKVIFKHEKEIDKKLKNLNNKELQTNIIFIDDFSFYKNNS